MKRYGNLWDKIIDIENIKFAHKQARRGKTYYTEVQMVDADLDKYAKEIQEMLINKTFTTSEYEIEDRHDGRKIRTIYKLPYYPDRIVQHALLNIVGPLITNCFIRDSFQSIIGRGTHDAAKRVKKLVRSENCPQYALKVDIKKYYQQLVEKLNYLGLHIKLNWNIYNVFTNGIDFVGFVFSPNKTKLRPSLAQKFKQKCVVIKKMLTNKTCLNSLMSYKGWVQRVNAKKLWRHHTQQFINIFPKQLRSAL